MKSFEYIAPSSLEQATDALSDTWGKTEVLAGGTDLVTSLKQRIVTPDRVVSLKNISSLRGIQADGKSVRIGSMTTLQEVAAHAAVREAFPSITTAIQGIGSAQIINVGTLGGDLCQRPRCWYFRNGYGLLAKEGDTSLVREGDNRYHSIFGNDGWALFSSPSSLGPPLIALGATLEVVGSKGQKRTVPAAEFFRTPKADTERETVLKPNEILTAIQIPLRGLKNATHEVRHRYGLDWPYVTATVALQLKGGVASDSRVVLGHVAPAPWVSGKTSIVLDGAKVDAGVAAKCGDAAAEGAKPLSGNAYKVHLVKVAVKRAVSAAAGV